VTDKNRQVEGVENEMIEWRICLEHDTIQFVVAGPEGRGQKDGDHRVCQS